MSAVNDTAMLTCANCATEFPQPAARRGGRVQRFCSPKCRVAGGNSRRATTRSGRIIRPTDNGPTNPRGVEPSGRPIASEATNIPPSVKTPPSDSPDRLSVLMEKAHSRGGVNAFEIAEIARARGISPWAPLAKIIGRA